MSAAYLCWHRPGRLARSFRVCRHCGVAVETCGCVSIDERHMDAKCAACHGSGWVAIIRSQSAKIAELFDAFEARR